VRFAAPRSGLPRKQKVCGIRQNAGAPGKLQDKNVCAQVLDVENYAALDGLVGLVINSS
jgi:hypothetical protein